MIKNKKIQITKEKEYILIDIKEECLFVEYIEELESYKDEKFLIPIRMFILDPSDFIDSKLQKQKIYYFNNLGFQYIVTVLNDRIKISQRNIKDKFIHEIMLVIDHSDEFGITKYIHNINNRTKLCKEYNSKSVKENKLEKKEALILAQNLLDNLKKMSTHYKIINVYYIYRKLNLIPSTWYNPIVSDNVITLSSNRYSSIDNVNVVKICSFNIILNDTKEKIGEITFNLKNEGFTYCGNVKYEIKEKFRNKGYASRALKLLKEIVKTNNYIGDNDLFISTSTNNIASQKVAEKNDGILLYEGNVPQNDIFNYKYDINEVKVYQIRMNREHINN